MLKLPVRRELAHPALVLARKSKEHIADPVDGEIGKWRFVVGENLVPEEGLALIVFECFLYNVLKIWFVPELEMGLLIGHFSCRTSCETRQFIDVYVVAVP